MGRLRQGKPPIASYAWPLDDQAAVLYGWKCRPKQDVDFSQRMEDSDVQRSYRAPAEIWTGHQSLKERLLHEFLW